MDVAIAESAPSYAEDIFSLDGIRHPYAHYRAIRDTGGAVWLPQHKLFAIGRHSYLGMHLARLEMSAILEAMIRHVSDIQIENTEFATITSLHGLERMTARFRTH